MKKKTSKGKFKNIPRKRIYPNNTQRRIFFPETKKKENQQQTSLTFTFDIRQRRTNIVFTASRYFKRLRFP